MKEITASLYLKYSIERLGNFGVGQFLNTYVSIRYVTEIMSL